MLHVSATCVCVCVHAPILVFLLGGMGFASEIIACQERKAISYQMDRLNIKCESYTITCIEQLPFHSEVN